MRQEIPSAGGLAGNLNLIGLSRTWTPGVVRVDILGPRGGTKAGALVRIADLKEALFKLESPEA